LARWGDDALVLLQTFTRWVNTHLQKRQISIASVTSGLQDGVNLCHLLEILSESKILGWKEKSSNYLQKLDNLSAAMKFMVFA
jgi:hypothetical protein